MYAVYEGQSFQSEGQKYPVENGQLYEIDVYPQGYNSHITKDTVFIKDEEHGCIATIPYKEGDWKTQQPIIEYTVLQYVSGLCSSDYRDENPDTGDFSGSVEYDDEFEEGTFEGEYIVYIIADSPEKAKEEAVRMYEEVANCGVLNDCSADYPEIIGKTDVTRREFFAAKAQASLKKEKTPEDYCR